jgi:hypothetical protein
MAVVSKDLHHKISLKSVSGFSANVRMLLRFVTRGHLSILRPLSYGDKKLSMSPCAQTSAPIRMSPYMWTVSRAQTQAGQSTGAKGRGSTKALGGPQTTCAP